MNCSSNITNIVRSPSDRLPFLLCFGVIGGMAIATLAAHAEDPDLFRGKVEIRNNTGQDANDLHLQFDGGAWVPTYRTGAGTGRSPKTGYWVNNPAPGVAKGQKFEWSVEDLGETVPPGATRHVEWLVNPNSEYPLSTRIIPEKSYWTFNNAPLEGNVQVISAQVPRLPTDPDGSKRVIFENPEEFPIAYLNVQVYLNNDIQNFVGPDYESPTGELFPDIPGDIIVEPGEVVEFAIPPDMMLPNTYHLVLAHVASLDDPEASYAVSSAYAADTQFDLSCEGHCGGGHLCRCDDACADFGDCCIDVCDICSDVIACGADLEPCPGDLNDDGSVGVPDLLMLLACWGPLDPASECEPADLNGDGVVGVPDLLELLAQWGQCPDGGAPQGFCVEGNSYHGFPSTCEECKNLFPSNWKWKSPAGTWHGPGAPDGSPKTCP